MDYTTILDEVQIGQKIKRIAYQVIEHNLNEQAIILAGIAGDGYEVAKRLKSEISKVKKIQLTLIKINIDKNNPANGEITFTENNLLSENQVIILVDDVLYTGRTIAYCLAPFLSIRAKKIETAVLVNRSHTKFPIASTYTGYELCTTLKDHVEVDLSNSPNGVYLK